MHNYQKKIARLRSEGRLPAEKGKSYSFGALHDDWCHVYTGGECNCDPDITCVEITEENRDQLAHQIAEDSEAFRKKMKAKMA